MNRRDFLRSSAAAGLTAALGDLGFLQGLPAVSAAEAKPAVIPAQAHPEIEALVRFLEDTPRGKILEELAARIRRGLTYREIIAALMLAGVRNIQPRPVGFKFHAVLVVNSAHLASLASADSDRWLPIFWAVDQFKSSQAADVREGDWTMQSIEESKLPPPHKARAAFIQAMDEWDEGAADAAVVSLARTASAHDLFDLFARYGVRDFREIGHKAIYVANSFRTLEVIGWHHAEPILRSLAYGLLDRDGARQNPAKSDLPADRPFRRNVELIGKFRDDWRHGSSDPSAGDRMIHAARQGSAVDTSELVVELLNKGTSPESIFDGMFSAAGELLMQAPGILSLHAVTFANAVRYAFNHAQSDRTRRLLLIQQAAFLPLYRGNRADKGLHIDKLEPLPPEKSGAEAVEEIFHEIGQDRLTAARKTLAFLKAAGDPKPFADAARRLIFLKGRDSHDYKFSSAVLEDYHAMSPSFRDRFLATSVFQLRGAGLEDNELVRRTRAALQA